MGLRALTLTAFWGLLAEIAVYDCRKRKIPNKLILFLGIVGAASVFSMPEMDLSCRLAGFFAASLPLFMITMVSPGAFGGGDIKLMAAAGFFLGGKRSLVALLAGIFLGGAYAGLCLLLRKKGRKDRFAFGPFLCIGIVLAYFLGDMLWQRYML